MPPLSFEGLLRVALIAFGAPLLLGLAPRLRVPAVVWSSWLASWWALRSWVGFASTFRSLCSRRWALHSCSGWNGDRLRPPAWAPTANGRRWAARLILPGPGTGLREPISGLVRSPTFLAIVLVASSLGLVLQVLKDAGLTGGSFGQMVIASASLADFGAVILLSLLFSREARSPFTGAALR